MKFIEVTELKQNKDEVQNFINLDNVQRFIQLDDKRALITFVSGDSLTITDISTDILK